VPLTSVQSFYSPEDSKTVIELLDKHEDSALIVAGGTFLHGLVSRGLLAGIEALINIQKLGLNKITFAKDKVAIGATTIFAQLHACEEVQEQPWLGAIKDAMAYPPVQVMNSATIGGSIAASCVFFDLPPSLLALDGSVEAEGASGERTIPLAEFFSGLFENALASNEFVTGISIPVPAGTTTSAFIKMEANANDLAILNIAVSLQMDDAGKCENARVFLGGGVGETPVRSPSAETALSGETVDDATIEKAGQAVLDDVDPLSDHRASAEYRKAMSKVLLQRTLRRAIERLS
jgi:aerobic carbon-monoxide dehydrogenase medium subunit